MRVDASVEHVRLVVRCFSARLVAIGPAVRSVEKQVVRLVVVHLHVRHRDLVRRAVVRAPRDFREQSRHGSRDDASVDVALCAAGDGEGFSRTRLPVRENSAVESVERAQRGLSGDAVEHLVLARVRTQHAVELEPERLALVVDVPGGGVARDLEPYRLLRLRRGGSENEIVFIASRSDREAPDE